MFEFGPFFRPLNDTQPFTFRDSYTFLERIMLLSKMFEQLNDAFDESVKRTLEIINTVNNRVGSPEAIHVDLSNGNKVVNIPAEFPTNHDFYVVVNQGPAGGNTITFPSNITGGFQIDPAANSISIVHVMPNGDGSFFVDQTVVKLVELINSLDTRMLAGFDQLNNSMASLKTELEGDISASLTASKAYTDSLRVYVDQFKADVAVHLDNIEQDLNADIAQVNANLVANKTELTNLVNANKSELTSLINTKVDKSVIINVKDYGAVGDGVTDDTAAIRAAIAAAGASNMVLFPKGRFVISDTIRMMLHQTITGVSMSGDVASPADSAIVSTHSGVAFETMVGTITNIRFEGPGFRKAGAIGISSKSSSLILRDVAIRHYETALYLNEVWYLHAERLHIYENSTAVSVDYCYNATFVNCRINANRGDHVWGFGYVLSNRSMVTLLGGSIEGYKRAVTVGVVSSLVCMGVYFESQAGGQVSDIVGIECVGKGSNNIALFGCQIYISNHRYFVKMDNNRAGDRLTSVGNKFKSNDTANTTVAYYWTAGAAATLRVTLMGDSWIDVSDYAPTAQYRANTTVPPGAIIQDPYGSPRGLIDGGGGDGTVTIGGSLTVAGVGVNGITKVGISEGLPAVAGTVHAGKSGGLLFNTATNKLNVWTGTKWVNTDGTNA